jgi:hypothetical protein
MASQRCHQSEKIDAARLICMGRDILVVVKSL